MAVACNIIRGENQEILYTEAPNGARSVLFDKLAERFKGTQEALPIWLTTKTKTFKDSISSPQLNKHRATIMNSLNGVKVKQPTITVVENNKSIELDLEKIHFTNFNPQLGPNSLTTLVAYADPVGGGASVRLGRIRYKIKGTTIEIDSALLAPITSYKKGKISDLKGLGLGSKMHTELFKYALREGLTVEFSDNQSPAVKGMLAKLRGLGLVRSEGGIDMLNSFPSNFDENGEIDMPSVLDFIDREGVQEVISLEEQVLVKDNMLGINVNSSEELLSKLRLGFFPEGFFKPTRSSLQRINMYSSEEITDILTDEVMQEKARDFIYKLETLESPILNDKYLDETYMVVKDGSKNEIGKFKVDNPYTIEEKIAQELGGIEIRSEFEAAMMESDLGQLLAEEYTNKRNTRDDIFNRMSQLKPVGELSIEDNILTPITSRTRETMEQTLTEPSSNKLEGQLDFLTSLDDSMWRSAPVQVTEIIKGAVSSFRDIGLDASNLLNMAKKKPLADTKDFLNTARAFTIDANPNNFDNLVREYDTYFDINDSFKYKKTTLQEGITKENTYFIEGVMSGVDAYTKLGIIPVGENLFKRVDDQSTDQLIDAIINYMYSTNGYETILPQEAFKPAGFDEDGTINMAKMQDRNNALALRESVESYIRSEVNKLYLENAGPVKSEDLEKYVILFNYYNRSNDYSKFDVKPKMNGEYDLMVNEIQDLPYLTTEFAADFNKKIINEKLNNTKAYADFYSNFKFTRTGIDLISNDPISLSRMEPYLEGNKDIVDYFRSHKGRSPIAPVELNEPIKDILFMRNYYSNYPTALKPFTGEFTALSAATMAAKTKAPFIRTSRGVYELIQGVGRLGVYGKLEANSGQFKQYNLNLAPPTVEDSVDVLKKVDANVQDVTELKNLYDEAEVKRINDNYDNC